MIDKTKFKKSEYKTSVIPSKNIFRELGKNTYTYVDILSELIDNSVAAKVQGKKLIVQIEIFVDENGDPIEFVITDNAKGITNENLGNAISPAAQLSENSLNEHGLGMKQAVAGLGELNYLATKTDGGKTARGIIEFDFGELETYLIEDFPYKHGTEISIIDIKPILTTNSGSYSRDIKDKLGARYRRFLIPDSKQMDLIIRITNHKTGKVDYEWDIEEVKPIYFHPSTRTNKPVIENFHLEGKGWKAKLTFGYAPTNDEYEELKLDIPTKFHPYHVSLRKQGLDIIRNDRVILFSQLSELGITNNPHNDYNNIRGEISILEGFSTAITKNSIIEDEHYLECMEIITAILNGERKDPKGEKRKYLAQKTYPSAIPEKLLRDRLRNWLQNNPVAKKNDVAIEYAIEGIRGLIDILADKEAWELKTYKAKALDVYQLFMYMDIGKIDKGYLVASDFSTGAGHAVKHIAIKHNKEIVLSKLEDFPINDPPDKIERDEYY